MATYYLLTKRDVACFTDAQIKTFPCGFVIGPMQDEQFVLFDRNSTPVHEEFARQIGARLLKAQVYLEYATLSDQPLLIFDRQKRRLDAIRINQRRLYQEIGTRRSGFFLSLGQMINDAQSEKEAMPQTSSREAAEQADPASCETHVESSVLDSVTDKEVAPSRVKRGRKRNVDSESLEVGVKNEDLV